MWETLQQKAALAARLLPSLLSACLLSSQVKEQLKGPNGDDLIAEASRRQTCTRVCVDPPCEHSDHTHL